MARVPVRSILLCLALLAACASVASAAGRPSARQAERLVVERLDARDFAQPAVDCVAASRAARRCAWSGVRESRLCRGTYLVALRKKRLRARSTGTRCAAPRQAPSTSTASAPAAGASGAGEPGPSAPAPQTDAVRSTGPRYFGFNDNGVRAGQLSAAQDAALTAGVGANVTRLTFDWRWAEAQQGVRHLEVYDEIYRESLARGVRPIWIVMFAPQWAWDGGVSCDQWTQDCRYPPADAHLPAFASIVRELVRRYPESAAIEVWNEPNLADFWRPAPDAARYARLLDAAHDAVKAVDPAMPVLGASASNNQVTSALNVSLSDFLAGIYANGAAANMDGLSFHAYPWSLSLGAGSLFDTSLAQARAYGTPLWVTETGVSTTGADARYRFTEREQADALVAQLRALSAAPDVAAVLFHTLVEPAGASSSMEPGYGIVRGNLSPKPAYCALAAERGLAPVACR